MPLPELQDLLARGEVTLLETRADGRLRQVTTIALVRRPVDEVWARLVDFGAYETWMPAVADSTVVSTSGSTTVVDWTVSVMGPDVQFRQALTIDPAARTITGEWRGGALEGSRWTWRLVASGQDTIAYRELYTTVVDTNWFVKQAEDDQHTLEYGINVATGVVELRGLKAALGVP